MYVDINKQNSLILEYLCVVVRYIFEKTKKREKNRQRRFDCDDDDDDGTHFQWNCSKINHSIKLRGKKNKKNWKRNGFLHYCLKYIFLIINTNKKNLNVM